MDSLRYWVLEMHVDGFRFDLASTLARELYDVNALGTFFDVIHQDPVLSQVKLIAEPWDLGPGGYQVGNFPVLWTEWNGRYRDNVRRFWRGDADQVPELATRLAGSADLYAKSGRSPHASINFVTCHDGFTLEDLVSYEHKHNEANLEDNRDGTDDNASVNFGVEGPTNDAAILRLRDQMRRSLLATLAFSQGVPMLCAGDETTRTQRGNNNAYCQDNEISWLDWDLDERKADFLEFVRYVLRIRRDHPVFRRRSFFEPPETDASGTGALTWFRPDGVEMDEAAWRASFVRALQVRLSGDRLDDRDEAGRPLRDDTFLLLLSAHEGPLRFSLAAPPLGAHWLRILDTAREDWHTLEPNRARSYEVGAGSLVLFRSERAISSPSTT